MHHFKGPHFLLKWNVLYEICTNEIGRSFIIKNIFYKCLLYIITIRLVCNGSKLTKEIYIYTYREGRLSQQERLAQLLNSWCTPATPHYTIALWCVTPNHTIALWCATPHHTIALWCAPTYHIKASCCSTPNHTIRWNALHVTTQKRCDAPLILMSRLPRASWRYHFVFHHCTPLYTHVHPHTLLYTCSHSSTLINTPIHS